MIAVDNPCSILLTFWAGFFRHWRLRFGRQQPILFDLWQFSKSVEKFGERDAVFAEIL